MMRVAIVMTAVLSAAFAAPQFDFLTLKDGKIGVNFGGYHASAGLGGLLTGNSAHGGLSASAGTPYGQNAAAGLGGSADGNPRGFLYANANANPAVGASAGLGGEAGVRGYGGSEAHVNGIAATKNVHAVVAAETDQPEVPPEVYYKQKHVNSIQKIKPLKKYSQSDIGIAARSATDDEPSNVTQQSISDVPQAPATTKASDKTTRASSTAAPESHYTDEYPVVITNVRNLRRLHRERQRLRHQRSQTQIRESTKVRESTKIRESAKVSRDAQLAPAGVAEKPTMRPQDAPKDPKQSYNDYNVIHADQFSKTATKSLISTRSGFDVGPPEENNLAVHHQGNDLGVHHQYLITKTVHSPQVVERALDIPIGILQVIQNAFRW